MNNACVNGVCLFPSCTDGEQDGTETDVDCGGGACPACDNGKVCSGRIGLRQQALRLRELGRDQRHQALLRPQRMQ